MAIGKLAKETLILSAAAFWMRAVGLVYSLWLTRRIGAQALGLSQLSAVAYGFACTLCCAGMRLVTTQFCARAAAEGSGCRRAVRFCALWALSLGLLAGAASYVFSGKIAARLLGEPLLAPALRRTAAALPFLAVTNVLYGYYTAKGRLLRLSVLQTAEQVFSIGFVAAAMRFLNVADGYAAAAILASATAAAEWFSFALALWFLPADRGEKQYVPQVRPFLRIVLPYGASALLGSGLRSLQEVWIPAMLVLWGLSRADALTLYGTVGGVVYPILFFPSAVLASLSVAAVPTLTEAYARGDRRRVTALSGRLLRASVLFSIVCFAFVRRFSEDLAQTLFQNGGAGDLLRLFAPLILFSYLDLVTDGILRSIDRPVHATVSAVLDASFSLLLVRLLIPRFGAAGLVASVLAAKLLNLALSLLWLFARLSPAVHVGRDILLPLAFALAAAQAADLLPMSADGASALAARGFIYGILCAPIAAIWCGVPKKRRGRTETRSVRPLPSWSHPSARS